MAGDLFRRVLLLELRLLRLEELHALAEAGLVDARGIIDVADLDDVAGRRGSGFLVAAAAAAPSAARVDRERIELRGAEAGAVGRTSQRDEVGQVELRVAHG